MSSNNELRSRITHWSRREDSHLITLRLPATPEELIEYAEVVKSYFSGEDQVARVELDEDEGWLVTAMSEGSGLVRTNA